MNAIQPFLGNLTKRLDILDILTIPRCQVTTKHLGSSCGPPSLHVSLISSASFQLSNQVDKKGDNNAKLIREKRFEISLQQQQAHHVCFRCAAADSQSCFSNEALFIQSSTQTWRKSDTDVTLLTLNFFKKLLLLCGFSKVNDAHISLIETLQMLQIRHFGTTWFC